MNILILNWRDTKNPNAGGAEVLTYEITKRWVEEGNNVTWFASSFPKAKREELIEGIKIIRKGTWWTVHMYAFLYYLAHKKNVDVVIDEVHWFPFFSGVYARKKTILFACEVANRLFFTIFPFPISYIFRGLEKLYLYLYRNIPTMAISESTKEDLIKEGFSPQIISVLTMGITIPKNIELSSKEENYTFISVGRMNKQKGSEDVVEAFSLIRKIFRDSKLWFVGNGEKEYLEKLKNIARRLGILENIEFLGYVSEKEKFEYMSKAHILFALSLHEGWGLTVPEAGIVGTPAIIYDSAGLRNIVKNNKTGIIVSKNAPSEVAKQAVHLLNDKKEYQQMVHEAMNSYAHYTWDKTAQESLAFIKKFLS